MAPKTPWFWSIWRTKRRLLSRTQPMRQHVLGRVITQRHDNWRRRPSQAGKPVERYCLRKFRLWSFRKTSLEITGPRWPKLGGSMHSDFWMIQSSMNTKPSQKNSNAASFNPSPPTFTRASSRITPCATRSNFCPWVPAATPRWTRRTCQQFQCR
mgnify:CR=1 FL=1